MSTSTTMLDADRIQGRRLVRAITRLLPETDPDISIGILIAILAGLLAQKPPETRTEIIRQLIDGIDLIRDAIEPDASRFDA
jgi:hypothetical protein